MLDVGGLLLIQVKKIKICSLVPPSGQYLILQEKVHCEIKFHSETLFHCEKTTSKMSL